MDFVEMVLNDVPIRIFRDGTILVKRCNRDEYYEMKQLNIEGYKVLILSHKGKQKPYKVHRMVAAAYLGLDINDSKKCVDHINRKRDDNRVENLRTCTQQENTFNSNARGYHWYKRDKKWVARIHFNGKDIHLGYFDKEEDASNAYQSAKPIYHKFSKDKDTI